FDRDDPRESGVQLGDGWLTIPKIAALRLQPELIVLAGCATGKVSVTEGGELVGLVRGFLQAGASAMVTSFRPGPDEATTAFMQSFHARLADGLAPATALRATALAARAENPHPFHWAPFTLMGDGG
ncbi:MAG: CHAT domain-containing protein, partial [Planctomycetota bacterium]|nr:CHAT domain-containing protein [Planctomycetota bacterium]